MSPDDEPLWPSIMDQPPPDRGAAPFFGWRVVWAAFVVAAFGWGVSFYGPPVFLEAIHRSRGWPVAVVSGAVTSHFLVGAFAVANLPMLHRRFGLVSVTRAGAICVAFGFLGWALAREPWELFAATVLTGFGWATTGAAAINAMVSPWFIRRRPVALSTAYNGASVGGIVLSPLWVAVIAALGFPIAAAIVGGAMVVAVWWLSGRYFSRIPAAMGLEPDGDGRGATTCLRAQRAVQPLPGGELWRSRRFVSLAMGTSLGLFAQIGLIAHLFSLVVPTLGAQGAGFAAGLATTCAIAGRTALGWLLPPGADRRSAAAANYGVQLGGSLALLIAAGSNVPLLLLGVVLFGLGLGNATSLPPLIAQQDFAPGDTARVVALVTACSQGCYSLAPAAFGMLRGFAPDLDAGQAPMLFVAAGLIQLTAAFVLISGGRLTRDSAASSELRRSSG